MSNRKNIRTNVASLLVMVFVWIVIGTLVNFHQHHLFGKVLIFHASSSVTLKKDEHKTVVTLKKLGNNDWNGWAVTSGHTQLKAPYLSSDLLYAVIKSSYVSSGEAGIPLLRGPPLA